MLGLLRTQRGIASVCALTLLGLLVAACSSRDDNGVGVGFIDELGELKAVRDTTFAPPDTSTDFHMPDPPISIGSSTSLLTGARTGYLARTFMRLDIAVLPDSGTVIDSAIVRLVALEDTPDTSAPIVLTVHRITSEWDENELVLDSIPTFLATPSDTVTIGTLAEDDTASFAISLAQFWTDRPDSNFGMVWVPVDGTPSLLEFGSQESATPPTVSVHWGGSAGDSVVVLGAADDTFTLEATPDFVPLDGMPGRMTVARGIAARSLLKFALPDSGEVPGFSKYSTVNRAELILRVDQPASFVNEVNRRAAAGALGAVERGLHRGGIGAVRRHERHRRIGFGRSRHHDTRAGGAPEREPRLPASRPRRAPRRRLPAVSRAGLGGTGEGPDPAGLVHARRRRGGRPMTRAIAILALLLAAAPAGAQSRYSLRGAGEVSLAARSAARALGAAEAAASPATMSGNPANLSQAEYVTFYGTYLTEWLETTEPLDAGDRSRAGYSGVISNICLIFPMGPVTFGTGFLVGRRQGGTIVQNATTSTGEQYRQIFEADGNLLRVPALLAASWKGLEVGAGLEVMLLNSKRRWSNDFTQVDGFVTSLDQVRTSQWGVSWRGGVRIPIGRRIHLGGWVSLPDELSGTRNFESFDPTSELGALENDVTAEVARAAAVGFELRPFYGVRVVGDWVKELWTDVTPAVPTTQLVDVDRYAGGIEWAPSGPRPWPLRLGYRTENVHTLDVNGREVREQFVTGGSGFAVGGGRGEIDWFVEYGRRGDAGESEFFEEIWRVGVTLTGKENWTRRRKPKAEEEW